MQMVNATSAPNSVTGSGQKSTVFSGLKGLFRWLGGEKTSNLMVKKYPDGAFYIEDNGDIFAGPYKTAGAAKGQLTRYLKGYTPASRRPA